jgi:hypothetical protein
VIDSLRDSERRHHWFWMIGVLLLVWPMWVLPYRLIPSLYTYQAIGVALGVFTGIVLGIGRQGIDLLAFRLFLGSTAVLAATPAVCSGPTDCFHAYEIGLVGFGPFGTVLLAMFAIPTNVAWNRGISSLKPELPWKRLSLLKTWQRNVLWLCVVAFLLAFYFSLGIPFPQ